MIDTSMARTKKKEERGTCPYCVWPLRTIVDEFCSAWFVLVTALANKFSGGAHCKSSDVFHVLPIASCLVYEFW